MGKKYEYEFMNTGRFPVIPESFHRSVFRVIFLTVLVINFLIFTIGQSMALSISPDARTSTTVRITCTTTATLLLAANGRRRSFIAVAPPENTVTVFIGFDTSMTTSTGINLNARNSISDNTYFGAVYCMVASGTAPMIIAETSR